MSDRRRIYYCPDHDYMFGAIAGIGLAGESACPTEPVELVAAYFEAEQVRNERKLCIVCRGEGGEIQMGLHPHFEVHSGCITELKGWLTRFEKTPATVTHEGPWKTTPSYLEEYGID